MAKFIPSKKQAISAVESVARTGVGFALTGVGSAALAQAGAIPSGIGGLIGAGLGNQFIVKGDTEKKIVWAVAVLNLVDLVLEGAMNGGRGVIG